MTPLTPVPSEIIDQFVREGPLSVDELDAAVRRFKKALIERALGGELTHHLGYPPGGAKPEDRTITANGASGKTVLTDDPALAGCLGLGLEKIHSRTRFVDRAEHVVGLLLDSSVSCDPRFLESLKFSRLP